MAKKKKTGASARAGATKKKASRKAVKKKVAARKAVKKTAKKAVKKTVAAKRKAPAAVKAKKKAPARKKKQIVGEGDYAATRAFDQDQASFVKKNRAKIPAMGKAAEAALEGPEGDALREPEATAAARSRDTF